jgi:Tfp pilus assembly major pilin PilA
MKKQSNQGGFAAVELVLIIVVIVLLAAVGYLVYKNQHKTTTVTATTKSAAVATPVTTPKADTTKYLNITELGVRIKLTANIQDAYYALSTKTYNNGLPWVYLSVHSLDNYSGCKATPEQPGLASVGTFKQGDTDPVTGDYSKAYPDAPKIGDLYYDVNGNQYDCTLQKDYVLYTNARTELLGAYKTIEKIPN